jgi:hypothetical protein
MGSSSIYAEQKIRQAQKEYIFPHYIRCTCDGEDCWTGDIYKTDCGRCNRPVLAMLRKMSEGRV